MGGKPLERISGETEQKPKIYERYSVLPLLGHDTATPSSTANPSQRRIQSPRLRLLLRHRRSNLSPRHHNIPSFPTPRHRRSPHIRNKRTPNDDGAGLAKQGFQPGAGLAQSSRQGGRVV